MKRIYHNEVNMTICFLILINKYLIWNYQFSIFYFIWIQKLFDDLNCLNCLNVIFIYEILKCWNLEILKSWNLENMKLWFTTFIVWFMFVKCLKISLNLWSLKLVQSGAWFFHDHSFLTILHVSSSLTLFLIFDCLKY
jgi:hypothetical protein